MKNKPGGCQYETTHLPFNLALLNFQTNWQGPNKAAPPDLSSASEDILFTVLNLRNPN